MPDMQVGILVADKAFDADEQVIEPRAAAGKIVMIPTRGNRRLPPGFDRHVYKERHLIETFSARLGPLRVIATRCNETTRDFLTAVHLTASTTWLN